MDEFDFDPTASDLAVLDVPELPDDADAWIAAMLAGPEDF